MPRSLARQVALQLIYERLSGGDADEESVEMILSLTPPEEEKAKLSKSDREFIHGLLTGVEENEAVLREKIESHLSEGWTMDRVNRVDLCVMLLGSYEVLFTDVPDNVAVSEAVNLADRFTEPKNKHFINAVLGGISRDAARDE